MKKISFYIRNSDDVSLTNTIKSLENSGEAECILVQSDSEPIKRLSGVTYIVSKGFASTDSLKKVSALLHTQYIVIYSKPFSLDPGKFAFSRMIQVMENSNAGIVYSDYCEARDNLIQPHPLIDYQDGSLRDDFNFGSVVLYNGAAFKNCCDGMYDSFNFAGLYDLRLRISQNYSIVHINEMLYTEIETDTRESGEKQFDYVDPRNRSVQIEMEIACTRYLKAIGGWLKPEFDEISFNDSQFEYEASVIIPVKNRAKTISDAIVSVLNQITDFKFNLIIIDNHSTDGTTEIIRKAAAKDSRIIHLIPERKNLGIGGCWNEGIFSNKCGKFAIQLDSDDLYIDEKVIDKIVKAFFSQKCAMVVGSYKMVDFKLNEIPPGIIDHKEWTPDNGRNNALRINGLGAPRAFYTSVLRSIRLPDVSYGEDYAVGLAISRKYQIGRIYEPLYLCRRWEENSDASLDIIKGNTFNYYKDKIRTIELKARIALIKGREQN